MKHLIIILAVVIWKPAYHVSTAPVTDPLQIEVNRMLKAEGYQLPHEFRSYLPTCNYWPLTPKCQTSSTVGRTWNRASHTKPTGARKIKE